MPAQKINLGSYVMIIKTTTNSVAAAVIFTVLSGISSLGNANLQEVDVKSVRVSYADLNLNQAAGKKTLYQRLRGAADQVCGKVQSKVARDIRHNRECFEDALDHAVHQVGNQDLLTMHQN